MKFAHLADCHIGGWREPKLRKANARSFCAAIDKCVEEKVDFVLLSGDLFDTAFPGYDSLRMAVEQLKRLQDGKIPVYFIAGSHDFSPSGKTMLEVIEKAGLGINVAVGEELADGRFKLNFTVDEKTGAKITGMIGKKGGLETGYYHLLAKDHLEQEPGHKIFLFHSALAELKPKELEKMDAMAVSLMPANFDYYAGGHVHVVDRKSLDKYQNIVYPGPIFPNNFSEMEKLKHGSFVIVDNENINHLPLKIHPTVNISIDAENKTSSEVETLIKRELNYDLNNAIVTVRVAGCLDKGRSIDIKWNDLIKDAYEKGAYFVMRNINALTSKEMEVIMIKESNVEDVEDSILKEHASQFKISNNDIALAKKLIRSLTAEKKEGERVTDFEMRVQKDLDVLFE